MRFCALHEFANTALNFCVEEIPLANNIHKTGGAMKLEFENDKFVTYLMISMMGLGFVVMLLI